MTATRQALRRRRSGHRESWPSDNRPHPGEPRGSSALAGRAPAPATRRRARFRQDRVRWTWCPLALQGKGCHEERSQVNEATVHRWTASDGVELAYHEVGQGRPAVLLHGLFSDANMNWIRFGHAARIAAEGFRVIMPDLRAHGLSARPHGEQYYPKGILARDLRELIAYLELTHFDLGGFSLGARTTVEGVGEGLR